MKLSKKALKAIHNPDARREISGVLRRCDMTIIRYIHSNKENGPLTTEAVIVKILEMTNLSRKDILERSDNREKRSSSR